MGTGRSLRCLGATVVIGCYWISASASAQSLNVDIDLIGGSPALGGGGPSSSYGAASGQAGFWNLFSFNPVALMDLSGNATGVNLSITASSTTPSVLGFNNASNSGDFALLFNDGSQVGTVLQGGTRTYEFTGLIDGMYQVYTYGSPPQPANPGEIFVNIPGSIQGTQMITGAHTPNTLALGVTHVIHTVSVVGGTLTINLSDNPGAPSAYVSGFQLVIPSPGAIAAFLMVPLLGRRRRR